MDNNEIVTTDLTRFGQRELSMLREILEAWEKHGIPDELTDGVTPHFNTHSGYVFLSDEDYNTAMLNDETGKLEMWYYTPYAGFEGFLSDLIDEYDNMCEEDKEFINYLKQPVVTNE